ncbi:ABC transporter ATP-binding protein [Mesobacillus jeotgali]|uniref:ABC transporter ATP-binding protein n=1 Tax=Mesobacillus jeotgali TaxID=129985 RepID=UPI0009A70A15|nr:ABC transporter ATP-binding protein [Mesobacillus jeotgali]
MESILYFVKKLHTYSGKILYINLAGMIAVSLLEGIGILFLIPMISMSGVINVDTKGTPIEGLFEFINRFPESLGLPIILAIYVLLVIGQNVLQRQITIRNTKIQHGFFRHLRIETYDALLHSNWNFFIKKRKSDIINSLTSEIATASAGTHSFLQFVTGLIFTIIQIGIAFWLSANITFFVLLSGVALLFFSRSFLKRSMALGNRNYVSGKKYLAGITDQINGIKDIKSNGLEESRMQWFKNVTKEMQAEQIEYAQLNTKSQLYYKSASAILIAGFLFGAVNLFNAHAGQLMLVIVIFSRLWPRVAGIQSSLEQMAMRIPSYQAVINLQNECHAAREFADNEMDSKRILEIEHGIECRNVFFQYNENKYALKNIDLFIPVKEMTAVVGKSGAGKSTLIDLLMALNKPAHGEVLVDGKPLTKEMLIPFRKEISYVPQDPFLFNASIRENLLLVYPNATEQELWNALEFSSAAEFVRKIPDGLDTLIGDRGIRLSGGERQRLVLARAILRNPSILVLDEATSALDTENEAKIQEALEKLKGKMTIIVIAHRLSTIRNADQVVVLEDGEIIQKGRFGQLALEKKSVFGKLLKNQMEVAP